MIDPHVNIRFPMDRIYRIAIVKHRHTFQGYPLNFIMRLRGINNGFYGNISMSVREMYTLRDIISKALEEENDEAENDNQR